MISFGSIDPHESVESAFLFGLFEATRRLEETGDTLSAPLSRVVEEMLSAARAGAERDRAEESTIEVEEKELLGLLGISISPDDLSSDQLATVRILAATLRFVRQVHPDIGEQQQKRLDGMTTITHEALRGDADRIQVVKAALDEALRDSADALELATGRSEIGIDERNDLRRASEFCRNPAERARLVASLVCDERPGSPEDRLAGEITRLWAFCKVVRALLLALHELDSHCEFYSAAQSGDLLVVASSQQSFPGPAPKPFASRIVPRAQFLGGAAVATDCLLPNDQPNEHTNTNHEEEGYPDRTLAIPVDLAGLGTGQMFVSIKGEQCPPWNSLRGPLLTLLSVAFCAGPSDSDESKWHSALSDPLSYREFQAGLRRELGRRAKAESAERLAIVVISASSASADPEPVSVAEIRDRWARYTCLRVAAAEDSPVYQLGPAAYAFVRRRMSEEDWEDSLDKQDPPLTTGYRASGPPAATLATWMVPWTDELRIAAMGRMKVQALRGLIERQVEFSADQVVELNEMQRNIRRGHYGRAYSLARELVDTIEEGSDCGVAIHELIRMALLVGNHYAARKYSRSRMRRAGWDIEGHLNYLLACVALGDLKSARRELRECSDCRDFRSAPHDKRVGNIYAMMDFARSIVPWLSRPTDELRHDLTFAVSRIAQESGCGIRVEHALDAIESWTSGDIRFVRKLEEMLETEVDDFRLVYRMPDGELQYWRQIAALRRLTVVLRGYVLHLGTPPSRPRPRRPSPQASPRAGTPMRPPASEIGDRSVRHRGKRQTAQKGAGREVHLNDLKGTIDFGIITITNEEYRAVLQRFHFTDPNVGRRRYQVGSATVPSGETIRYALARSHEEGNIPAQQLANDFRIDLAPRWFLLVGMAGGVPSDDFSLGDIVCARRLHDFSVAAAVDDALQFDVRGSAMHVDVQNLLSALPAIEPQLGEWCSQIEKPRLVVPTLDSDMYCGDEDWNKNVHATLERHFPRGRDLRSPKVIDSSIGSSNLLIKSSSILKEWLDGARSLAAVEMELAGVYEAARGADPEIRVLAIRGISDIVGFKREDRWKTYACEAAAAFAFALVGSGVVGEQPRGQ